MKVASGRREGLRGDQDQEEHYQCGKGHAGRHKGYKSVKERESNSETELFATGESNNVARIASRD